MIDTRKASREIPGVLLSGPGGNSGEVPELFLSDDVVEPYPKDHPGRPDSGRFKDSFVYAGDEPDDQGCRKRTSEISLEGSLTAPPEDIGDCARVSSGGWPVMVLKPKASGEPPTVVVRQKWYATPHEAYKAAQRALEKLHEKGETSWEVILG